MSKLELPVHDPATRPEPVQATLAGIEKQYGFLPNLYKVFAGAPAALESYLAVNKLFQGTSFTATERNVILLAASRENGCRYCVAVHSTVADMQKDPTTITDAIRNGTPIDDPRLEAVRRLAEALVRGRGHAEAEVQAFLDAGYRSEQVLELLVGVMLKTLSNYTNHLAVTPLDSVFAARAFNPENK